MPDDPPLFAELSHEMLLDPLPYASSAAVRPVRTYPSGDATFRGSDGEVYVRAEPGAFPAGAP